jgi:hypothetical protein
MLSKSKYIAAIESYLKQEINKEKLSASETQQKINVEFNDELTFEMDMEQAVLETDIFALRNKLNQIVNQRNTITDLIEDMKITSIPQIISNTETADEYHKQCAMKSADFVSISQPLPQLHLSQHLLSLKENIYDLSQDQNKDIENLNDEENFNFNDNLIFEDVQIAIDEKDVLDLRANLQQIASIMTVNSYPTSTIENFISNEMDKANYDKFTQDLLINDYLAQEVNLFNQVNEAIQEVDVIQLRAKLQEIHDKEFRNNTNVNSFEKAQNEDNELIKEIKIAINETDIVQIRAKLKEIGDAIEKEKQSKKLINFNSKTKKIAISVVAASLVLMLSITGILKFYNGQNDLYEKYYSKYESFGVARSAFDSQNSTLNNALVKFNQKDYESAIILLQDYTGNSKSNAVKHFYTGVAMQETGKYQTAIAEYEFVIFDKDNLFVEQAEWYIGLCYLKTNDQRKAMLQFRKIYDKKGYYHQKAEAIIRRMKNIN